MLRFVCARTSSKCQRAHAQQEQKNQVLVSKVFPTGTAFGICYSISFPILNLSWPFFSGTWQKRRRSIDNQLNFEIVDMKIQMQ